MNNTILRRGKEESLKRFHPWIFSGAILRADGPLQEGDLVFFTTPGSGKKCGHVGIYLKGDRFIHASTSRGVMVSSLNESFWDKHWLCGGQSHRRKR